MEGFRFSPFTFILSSSSSLPLLGSTLRGGFGHIFRHLVCLKRGDSCASCILKYTCPYSYIFQTPLPPNSHLFSRTRDIPRPYIIDLSGEGSSFNLVLVGKGIDYLPYFVLVFDALGKRGLGREKNKFMLKEVKDGERKLVYSQKEGALYSSFKIYTWKDFQNPQPVSRLALHFLSPLRLKIKNKLLSSLTFPLLIKSLSRRISLLSEFHCGQSLWNSLQNLFPLAEKIKIIEEKFLWHDIMRYSTRQKRKMKLGGIKGRIVVEGELTPFLPLLRIGEYIHVGKGTTFGLGKYRLEILKK